MTPLGFAYSTANGSKQALDNAATTSGPATLTETQSTQKIGEARKGFSEVSATPSATYDFWTYTLAEQLLPGLAAFVGLWVLFCAAGCVAQCRRRTRKESKGGDEVQAPEDQVDFSTLSTTVSNDHPFTEIQNASPNTTVSCEYLNPPLIRDFDSNMPGVVRQYDTNRPFQGQIVDSFGMDPNQVGNQALRNVYSPTRSDCRAPDSVSGWNGSSVANVPDFPATISFNLTLPTCMLQDHRFQTQGQSFPLNFHVPTGNGAKVSSPSVNRSQNFGYPVTQTEVCNNFSTPCGLPSGLDNVEYEEPTYYFGVDGLGLQDDNELHTRGTVKMQRVPTHLRSPPRVPHRDPGMHQQYLQLLPDHTDGQTLTGNIHPNKELFRSPIQSSSDHVIECRLSEESMAERHVAFYPDGTMSLVDIVDRASDSSHYDIPRETGSNKGFFKGSLKNF